MKRWIALVLTLLLFYLAGCGRTEPAEDIAPIPAGEEPTEQETVHIHGYDAVTVEMTCTEDGYTEYTCGCGDVYVDAVREAPGHAYQDEVFEPTIAADGFTRHTCTVCGEITEDSVVPMLPDGIEDGSFFDDAAFVGDSIVESMKTYVMLEECFGEATFLCRPGFSLRFIVDDSMKMTYRGRYLTIPEALEASGVKKVFFLLGMNDIATLYMENNVGYWETLIAEIRERCPDILIFLQSGTPIYKEKGMLTNAQMEIYNELLAQVAEDNDCFYVDIATPLKDENGFLLEEYCSDHYCHLSMEGCAVWERTLKDYLLEHKGEFA